ncbi:hypothetical protein [Kluyvera ascorbata]|uniref:hypothetical protein n=1 Tax=Kluyvera ascorbata TaxID=51288 RepID=UPI002DBC8656|nr:hypothetical protein [Kluyvera ascorbata]MEB6387789.1 hypothetical protein [Kluyvera ascorbata]
MSKTYQICEVAVMVPPLGAISNDGFGNQIKHGEKFRVHLYAVKPDWHSGSNFEGFIVGWFTREGYSDTQHKSSQKIMMPDGYKLIALSVDEYGLPKSWDSLPVYFTGGCIDQKDGDGTVRVIIGKINGAEPIVPQITATVFINDVFISAPTPKQPSADSSHNLSINIEGILKSALENAASAAAKQEEAMSDLRKLIDKSIEESIRLNCRPGGAIWQATKRG